ncbi:unnamed protein product [Lasius platythorax]|uniref:Uncharacterized protein n=1 Tax=Lasius platythorax TaxID=488582 RepID=A0AAV2N4B0_9HYME
MRMARMRRILTQAKRIYVPDGAFDAPSTVAQVQFPFRETQGGLIALRLNAPRHELAPLFGELSRLKADHPYRGRESCHLKYINSLISLAWSSRTLDSVEGHTRAIKEETVISFLPS